jgi:hypothetical protein
MKAECRAAHTPAKKISMFGAVFRARAKKIKNERI